MSGIALRYRVSLDALKTANPSANPRLILVGQVLVIPAGTPVPGATAQPSPTAAKILADLPRCLRDEAGGAWCFTLVRNTQTQPVESVTVRLRLVDGQGKQVSAQVISTALDLLPAGKTLPAGAYFPAPLPAAFQAGAEVVSTLPVKDESSRYLGVKIENQKTTLSTDSASVAVSGKLTLAQPERKASQVKVAAAGYTADGTLVGLRIWEGQSLEFSFTLYAVSAKITRVEVLAEAKP
jgi:LysM repeat protein